VVQRSLAPEWNETLEFEGVLAKFVSAPLTLRVFDKDTFTRDDALGEALVGLDGLRGEDSLDFVEALSTRGYISFSVSWEVGGGSPASPPAVPQRPGRLRRSSSREEALVSSRRSSALCTDRPGRMSRLCAAVPSMPLSLPCAAKTNPAQEANGQAAQPSPQGSCAEVPAVPKGRMLRRSSSRDEALTSRRMSLMDRPGRVVRERSSGQLMGVLEKDDARQQPTATPSPECGNSLDDPARGKKEIVVSCRAPPCGPQVDRQASCEKRSRGQKIVI